MTLGERILTQRKKLGMSQDELAKKTGYASRASINKIENDLRDLPRSKVISFANALNVSISYIMGWEDEDGNDLTETSPIDILKSELGINEFTEEEKKQIIQYIRFIISQRQ